MHHHHHSMQQARGAGAASAAHARSPLAPPPSAAAAAAAALQHHQHHAAAACRPPTARSRHRHHHAAAAQQHSGGGGDAAPDGDEPTAAPAPESTTAFHPRRVTYGLQRTGDVYKLRSIWQQHQHQFNSIHFSVLMQQLTKLHDQVAAGVAPAAAAAAAATPTQRQQQEQTQRSASLAELEQELGHLLDSSDTAPPPRAAAAAAAAPAAGGVGKPSGSSIRRVGRSSRGLADLCPALDGYEHLTGAVSSSSGMSRQQQQPTQPQQPNRPLRWRSEESQTSQPQAAAAAEAAAPPAAPAAASNSKQPQLQRPQWQPPSTNGTSRSSGRPSKRQQRQQQPQQSQQQQQQQQQEQEEQEQPDDAEQQLQLQRQQRHRQEAIRRLALTVADAALQPGRQEALDNRALVMVAHNLAKMQLHSQPLLSQLVQVLHAGVLPGLDAQQLTNLIWSVGSCVSSSAGRDSSPYTLMVQVPRWTAQSSSSRSAVVPAEPAADSWGDDDLFPAPSALSTSGSRGSSVTSSSSSGSGAFQPPGSWLAAAADCLLQLLPQCSSQGVAMALWGFAQLGFSPPVTWWGQIWEVTLSSLPQYSPQDLALLMCAVGKLGPEVPSTWLSCYCSAAVECLPSMSTQQLTMCLWGLAAAGASPHKAFVLLWFLQSKRVMELASTQELSMWLYSLALLRLTPAPTWCVKFVESSFAGFTAPSTRPQDLVTAMWSISKLGWGPPLLYWRGLMEAARQGFARFGPQDMANCVSAAAVVDISCMSDSWLAGFIKASQPLLPAFAPVQLAHTANALAIIANTHPSGYRLVHAAWQEAFVRAAAPHLAAGAFSARNLCLVASGLRALQFKPRAAEVQQFLADVQAAINRLKVLQQSEQQQQAAAAASGPPQPEEQQ